MGDRAYLSIGEVLSLLKDEFPDVTISKIRFLESQGLLDPERTASGYRKFYDPDVERLRWILRQQREHFLPLKVIKGRLGVGSADDTEHDTEQDGDGQDATSPAAVASPGRGSATAATSSTGHATVMPRPATETDSAPSFAGSARPPATAVPLPPSPPSAGVPPAPLPPTRPAPAMDDVRPPVRLAGDQGGSLSAGMTGVSLTMEELASATGLPYDRLRELERYGFIAGRPVAGTVYYDEESLVVANLAVGFARFGIEGRHLRIYKNSAEREAGLFEQIVTPLLKQRNPEARRQAVESLEEMTRLGQSLRAAVLRQALRRLSGG